MFIAAIVTMVLAVLLGLVLALITLPGVWLMLAIALGLQLWQPGLFSWWTLGACVVVALIGELIELALSAVTARHAGGSRRGAMASVIGALVGAIIGSPWAFPLGTIAGAVLGAGLGAFVVELGIIRRSWRESGKIAFGASVGRLGAVLVKVSVAGLVGVALIVAVVV
jgi:uncharacterized protein YqgC (DUF456 family)